MIKSSKPSDLLLLYLYGETSVEEAVVAKTMLLIDGELDKEFEELVSLKQDLDAFAAQPSAEVVKSILLSAKSKRACSF